MIFPGMDPYLENPHFWPGLHTSLIVSMCGQLQPLLKPRYVAAIEERVFVESIEQIRIPDVVIKRQRHRHRKSRTAFAVADEPVVVRAQQLEVPQRFIEILDRQTGQRVVTVIELVSPSNKYDGSGRTLYRAKQRRVLRSKTHLVEIDLLRTGRHVLAVPESVARANGAYDYLACVNRASGERDEFDLYPKSVRQRLPRIRIPLVSADPDVPLDVQDALENAYEIGGYDLQIDYTKPCKPPLSPADQAWCDQLVKKAFAGNGRNGKQKYKD